MKASCYPHEEDLLALLVQPDPFVLRALVLPMTDSLARLFPTAPELTAARRLRHFAHNQPLGPQISRPLDVQYLRTMYGPERMHEPRVIQGHFTVPIDMRVGQYRRLRDERINRWVVFMDSQGWDWTGDRVTVERGMYPAIADDGRPMEGVAEFIATTTFTKRNPTVERLELPPELLETQVGGSPDL